MDLFGSLIAAVNNLYALLVIIPVSILFVTWLLVKARKSLSKPPKPGPTRGLVVLVFVVLIIQLMHFPEHIAQVTQQFILAIRPAHGLIGTFDLEPVHFIYNGALLIGFVALFFVGEFYRKDGWPWSKPKLAYIFTGLMVFQGYHVIEHVAKISQFLQTGLQGTPGILGRFISLIFMHYYFVGGVVIVYLVVVVGYGFETTIYNMLFQKSIPMMGDRLIRASMTKVTKETEEANLQQ